MSETAVVLGVFVVVVIAVIVFVKNARAAERTVFRIPVVHWFKKN